MLIISDALKNQTKKLTFNCDFCFSVIHG